uniref:Transmembrane protein n=1 Tax=Zooxanthella nutricula TaxID=1333877 RepID=A0A7S2VRL0_9DINO|mmetsp:Transcript_95700/g.292665  ORF Transcript_95700/g.292665 Transcript_95700/m.292665 type:complete len:569 (+) Transcript_95700:92-1798(+)
MAGGGGGAAGGTEDPSSPLGQEGRGSQGPRSNRSLRDCEALKRAGLFRAALVSDVLSNFAAVFAEGVKAVAAVGGADRLLTSAASPEDGGDEHRVADEVFYSSPVTSGVDFFISHVWTTARWQKHLGLCYYVNVGTASVAAVFTWLGAAAVLIALRGYAAYGGQGGLLVPCLVYLPVAVFVAFFVFGHAVVPWLARKQAWLDKLCIHQSRTELKCDGVSALPTFVLNSSRLLILWSETYFERLWCNVELATFCTVHGAHNVDFMPMWLAPWVLTTIALDLVAISLMDHFLWLIPVCGDFFAARLGDSYPLLVGWLTQTFGIGLAISLAYIPMTPFSLYSFSKKIEAHDLMMSHMRGYRFAAAKCTVESDRVGVRQLIERLFQNQPHLGFDPEAPQTDPIQRFDRYINTDFAEAIAGQVGGVTRLPYSTCCLAFMPLMFESLANVIGCDSMPCEMSYNSEGYASIPHFMLTNAAMWCFGNVLIYPTTYPVMLTGLVWCRRKLGHAPQRSCMASFAVMVGSYLYMGFLMGAVCGVIGIFSITQDVMYGVILMVVTAVLAWWNYVLFKTSP